MALAAQPRVRRKKVLGFVAESAPGTSGLGSLTTANSVVVSDILAELVNVTADGERRPMGHYHGEIPAIPGPYLGTLSFSISHRHGDGLLTLLTGCGFWNDSGTYKPSTFFTGASARSALSFYVWEDGIRKGLVGAQGTVTFSWSPGQGLTGRWSFMGVWQSVADASMPALAPVTTAANYSSGAGTYTINNATAPVTDTWSLELGNSVEPRQDWKVIARMVHAYIADRRIRFSNFSEGHLVADYAPHAGLLAGTTLSGSGANGLVLGLSDWSNSLTFTGKTIQRESVGDSERNASQTTPEVFRLCPVSGDDELTVVAA